MKTFALILLVAVCYAECRKIYAPINKNANVDFINMESGGVRPRPAVIEPPKPAPAPAGPAPTTKAPTPNPVAKPAQPSPVATPAPHAPAKPVTQAPVAPQKPVQVPVRPAPVANPTTTPLPGSVKSLINYYDSKGNASPIRPYSYSQAVKQGK